MIVFCNHSPASAGEHAKTSNQAIYGGARLCWLRKMTGRNRGDRRVWLKVKLAGTSKKDTGSGSMAVSGFPGCIHKTHKPGSVVAWLETWLLKTMQLATSVSASNILNI